MFLFLAFCELLLLARVAESYMIDDSTGLGPRFDGIGGISGGGATSRLLVSYPEPYRSQILDYLFTPNFGASVHILKVEIGGDAQSTDGTEASHMHSEDDLNYKRGYEWWIMQEAKKRNPKIKLYGLPWGWPGWVGNFTASPYVDLQKPIKYILNWIKGAKTEYGLTIDYIGIWNELAYNKDYIKLLRKSLDGAGFPNVEIVAADGKFEISYDVLKDKELAAAISVLGFHYPGTYVTNYTTQTGMTLWSSEDYSTFNDNVGAGCWARILNQNYINGNMTSTISWNLIASYYETLPFYRDGLMTAVSPWSGNYVVEGPVWASAHTTQFTEPGYSYYNVRQGAGHLDQGGSYVSLTDGKNLTIVIETMSHDHSKCIRPPLPAYNVTQQVANFIIKGKFASITALNVFYSKPGFGGNTSTYFVKKSPIKVTNGQFSLDLNPDEIYTLTTHTVGRKGSYPDPPPAKPFPVPYSDNFDTYPIYSEAIYFADQAGCFEIRDSGDKTHSLVLQQVATSYPVAWCHDVHLPFSIVGNASWMNSSFSIDARIAPSSGVLVAFRVMRGMGGCKAVGAKGVFFWIKATLAGGQFNVTSDIGNSNIVTQGAAPVKENTWFTISMTVSGGQATGSVDGKQLFDWINIPSDLPTRGFIAIGTTDYSPSEFDNFFIKFAS